MTAALAGTPVAGRAAEIAHGVASGGGRQALTSVPTQAKGIVEHAATHAFVSGLNELFLIGGILAFAGAVLTFLLVRQSDFVGHAQQAPAAAG